MDPVLASVFHDGDGMFFPNPLNVISHPCQGPIVGILYDRLGPTHLLMAGTSLHIFGLLMLSNSTTYLEILLWQGVCSAIGVSAILQPCELCLLYSSDFSSKLN